MSSFAEVRRILEQAAVFVRAEDPNGAIARANLALDCAGTDEEARGEAELALERFTAVQKAWLEDASLRGAALEAEELAEVYAPLLADEPSLAAEIPSLPLVTARQTVPHFAH